MHYLGMPSRVFHLNPLLPLVWQNPDTLQIGINPPVVVLSHVPDDVLLLMHHLGRGVSESGLAMFAKAQGVSPERTQALLKDLAPALGRPVASVVTPFVLDGPSDLATQATRVLSGLGHSVVDAANDDDTPESTAPGEVLVFGHFVPHPHSFHRWLRIDRPHTPVVFSDQTITVGPRIVPGHTRCMSCALTTPGQSPRVSAALASQLWGRVAPSATPEGIRLATWHARSLTVDHSPYRQIVISDARATTRDIDEATLPQCECLGSGWA